MARLTTSPVFIALLVVLSGAAWADTLVTTDGRTFEGRLISQTPEKVTFEVRKYGIKGIITFDAKEVSSVTKTEAPQTSPIPETAEPGVRSLPEPVTPTAKVPVYYLLPLHGEVGTQITADLVSKAIEDTRKRNLLSALILEIDSPGGSIADVERIVQLIGEVRGLRVIACVRNAISAAAPIAMACREIYIAPSGSIGGAVVFRMGPTGTPEMVDEKLRSIWRAVCRSAAEVGGHSPLLAQGMVETDIELSVVEKDGKQVVVEGVQGKPLKARGKVLTLTAQEAIACGLANGEFKNYPSLGQTLGLAGWREAGDAGRQLARGRSATLVHLEKQLAELANVKTLHILSMAKYDAILPQLNKIEDLLKILSAEGRAAERTKALLAEQYAQEAAKAEEDYASDVAIASQTAPQDPTRLGLLLTIAGRKKDSRLAEIRQRMQPQALELQNKINHCQERCRALLAKRTELIMTLTVP